MMKSPHPGAGMTRNKVSQPAGPVPVSLRRLGNGVIWQASCFALVGLANTALDFAIYNALTSQWAGWARIPANMVSTTVAMTFSFVVNLLWVFNPEHCLVPRRAGRFLLVTACALYGVQNLVIWLLSNVWPGPANEIAQLGARLLAIPGGEELIARNVAKLAATAASLIWNYFWYRFYVYKNNPSERE